MRERSALRRRALSLLGILCLVLTSTTISAPFSIAQETTPSSQEPAKQSATADLPPDPVSPIEKAKQDGTAIALSLKEVTKLALQNNLDIAIQDTNEELYQQKIIQAFGNYDPSLTASLGVNSSRNANTNSYNFSTGKYNTRDAASWSFTFAQPVRSTGGTFQAQWDSQRNESNSTSTTFNPQYGSTLTLQFKQPLWRNLRIDSNRGNLKLVNLDLKNNDSQFKQKVTETISSIQDAYWDLVLQIQNYAIQRNSVKLAQISLRDNRKRVEVGTLAPIDVTESEGTAAQREVSLISAEESIQRAENNLRSLVSSDRKSDIWQKVIVPTDMPDFQEFRIDSETAIATAIKNHPLLEQAQISLERLAINRKMQENEKKWKFDLTGQFGSTGTAGPKSYLLDTFGNPLLRDGQPVLATPEALVGGLGTSYKTMFNQGYTNWRVTFDVTIPVRSRTIDAQLAQNQIDRQQQLMTLRKQEQNIQVDVRNAVQKLETSKKQVLTAGTALRLSKERLTGEEKRFQAGLSENYRVLDAQNNLAQAEYNELSARVTYKQTVIALHKAMYTLLEINDFEVAKTSSDNVNGTK